MKKTIEFNNDIFHTKIAKFPDRVRIEQIDKITGETHKVVLMPEEFRDIKQMKA